MTAEQPRPRFSSAFRAKFSPVAQAHRIVLGHGRSAQMDQILPAHSPEIEQNYTIEQPEEISVLGISDDVELISKLAPNAWLHITRVLGKRNLRRYADKLPWKFYKISPRLSCSVRVRTPEGEEVTRQEEVWDETYPAVYLDGEIYDFDRAMKEDPEGAKEAVRFVPEGKDFTNIKLVLTRLGFFEGFREGYDSVIKTNKKPPQQTNK